ncbi:4-diphosphocytidyl-2-C-methyl-D-erythritol kinase [Methylophilus rhizosphaerae]|uniref:4-diphosphocytidyl-2-C-methyl-D-erythritol kinase n=1 Tax=Methylophilus rhizosphaerae TaxID=492660 RepID=A0A1G9A4V8_9PROT|nr:4-(cytidine 5'-diphospho)-2-C-methyl-D-erythritol kinase [Methylophilus rhizosphaerae]SDK22356.1 4-diphosphocytidyl-2-C-methyl-D-erythritol kinase [Methylophilus rhizosphaerae]
MLYNTGMDASLYFAPCKLNLFLHITGRRADGYHALQSIFLLLDHGDDLHISLRNDGRIMHKNPLAGVLPDHDLAIRAARALQSASGCQLGADIHCTKRTPMGGGLGGGSSDAATVLLALNQLWQLNYSRQQLMQIGLSLGADVPVFIFGQPAWAEGVGEQLSAVSLPTEMLEKYYVVVTPHVQVPTAEIFAHQALTRDTKPLRIADFSNGANSSAFWQNARNDMEAVVCALYPEVANTLAWLKQYGDARMSGSGASVFVAVDSAEKADELIAQRPENTSGFWAKGLKYHPLFALANDEIVAG